MERGMVNLLCCFARNFTILGLVACLCILPLETCYGGRACTALGSRYRLEYLPGEKQLCSTVAAFIKTLAVFRNYEKANNWYGANTTGYNIGIAANASGEQYGIAFYVGHGDNFTDQSTGNKHWQIYDDGGNLVWDRWLYKYYTNYTITQRLRFTLIWSCWQGYTIGGTYPNGDAYGMPNAWLHTTNLSQNGYGYHDSDGMNLTFIGWKREAPFLTYNIWGENASYYFLLNFYNSALYYQRTIRQSLDDASAAVWHVASFAQAWWFHTGFWYMDPDEGIGWLEMAIYVDGSQRLR